MRLSLSIIVFICILCSCKKEEDLFKRTSYFRNDYPVIELDSEMKVVTYNIRLGFELEDDPWFADSVGGGLKHLKKLANFLKEIDADIVALQEVPLNRYNSIIKDYLDVFAAEMEMNYAFGSHGLNEPYIWPAEGEWGNAILTRGKINWILNHEILREDEWTRRSMIQANIQINDEVSVDAFSLHWFPDESDPENTTTILSQINRSNSIVMGDYNYYGEIEEFTKIGLVDVDSTYSMHIIDRILLSKSEFAVNQIGVVDSLISDHYPSWATLKLVN